MFYLYLLNTSCNAFDVKIVRCLVHIWLVFVPISSVQLTRAACTVYNDDVRWYKTIMSTVYVIAQSISNRIATISENLVLCLSTLYSIIYVIAVTQTFLPCFLPVVCLHKNLALLLASYLPAFCNFPTISSWKGLVVLCGVLCTRNIITCIKFTLDITVAGKCMWITKGARACVCVWHEVEMSLVNFSFCIQWMEKSALTMIYI